MLQKKQQKEVRGSLEDFPYLEAWGLCQGLGCDGQVSIWAACPPRCLTLTNPLIHSTDIYQALVPRQALGRNTQQQHTRHSLPSWEGGSWPINRHVKMPAEAVENHKTRLEGWECGGLGAFAILCGEFRNADSDGAQQGLREKREQALQTFVGRVLQAETLWTLTPRPGRGPESYIGLQRLHNWPSSQSIGHGLNDT